MTFSTKIAQKITTKTDIPPCTVSLKRTDRIMVLGSCFAANIGAKLIEEGYDVCVNPFGTLFNPASIYASIERMRSGRLFTAEECVQMGAGSALVCSFSHYTKFARATVEEFLADANEALEKACEFWRSCNKIIVTFGTAWVFRWMGPLPGGSGPGCRKGTIVSNCLKRDAKEFRRERLSVNDIVQLWKNEPFQDEHKEWIFTVSPIRHFKDGAHGNQISKATLLLAVDEIVSNMDRRQEAGAAEYFPSYEIVLDELRDYSWYAEDLVHPSQAAVDYIWKRFKESHL